MRFLAIALVALFVSACSTTPAPVAIPTVTLAQATTAAAPEWFSVQMTDARTGKPFTMQDFHGKVVLVETMATWCPNCREQEDEVKKMHTLLGNPSDVISVSLDTDLHEDTALLAKHVASRGYDWYFAIAPLSVDHDLGNLYSAEYLNPPLTPMLLIDRQGQVMGLPYGLKTAEALSKTVQKYLTQ